MKTQTITRKGNYVKTMVSLCLVGFIALFTTVNAQQTKARIVKGTVTTASGPLPYASITLKGTQVGIQADENGAFTFPQELKENDVLIISSLAYEDREFTITRNTSYIEPFLEGQEIVIIGALRTKPVARCVMSID
jgi:hypothetical protein